MERKVIILGSGIAGLYCALRTAQHSQVLLLTKDTVREGSSNYAQGGIAAVLDPRDSFDKHIRDTFKAGSQHNGKAAVRLLVHEAPLHIQELLRLGVAFTQQQRGMLDLTREGGHSQRRIVHAKDMTGRVVEQALITAVKKHPNITIKPFTFGLDLIKKQQRVVGVSAVHTPTQTLHHYFADAVVVATGGAGQVYPYTSNPSVVTGDGIAMAMRAGAKVADLEFVQFHPTAYYIPGRQPFLLSEALRGEGAHLLNYHKKRFIDELLPRDQTSRAVYRQQRKGLVYLDMRHKSKAYLKKRFPGIYQTLAHDGLYLDKHLIPITPIAHYLCGGVVTDTFGRTNLKGLFVIGEAARTGVHGANRLASNSLLECLVFAAQAAETINAMRPVTKPKATVRKYTLAKDESDTITGLRQQLQNVMWEAGGIVRTKAGLTSGVAAMHALKANIEQTVKVESSITGLELRNMAYVAEGILIAALKRSKSLGCHYRTN